LHRNTLINYYRNTQDSSITLADIQVVASNVARNQSEETMTEKINIAFQDWESKTQARFKKAEDNDNEYLLFTIDRGIDGSGSASQLGFKANEVITIRFKNEEIGIGTIIHEIGHALGLQHEHKRPDRDQFVIVNPENSDVGAHNFEILEEEDVFISGRYDYSSVMHYKENDALSLTDPTAVVGTSPRRLSKGDIKTARRILPSNVHIHQLGDNGSVGEEIARYCWTKGWTTAAFFKTREANYLFLLKEEQGEVHIQKMNSDGKVGARVFTDNWTSGWTNVTFFETNQGTYLFLLKEITGDVHIHKMNNDGTVGDKVFDANWTKGWTTTAFFQTTEGVFIFLLKEGTGEVHIHKINNNATVGDRVFDANWTNGWTNNGFYTVNNQVFLSILKKATGEIHVHKMNENGTVGNKVQTHFFAKKFWDLTTLYRKGSQNFLFLLNRKSGRAHIHEVNSQGIGKRIKTYNWSSGWTAFSVNNNLNDKNGIIFLLKDNLFHIEDLVLGGSGIA